jgi:hypothetical protein
MFVNGHAGTGAFIKREKIWEKKWEEKKKKKGRKKGRKRRRCKCKFARLI